MFNPRFFTLAGMIFSAAFMRLLPHPWNMTPVAAMALFGGAHFEKKRWAFAVPLSALFLSDLFFTFYPTLPVVYASFALIVVIGMALRNQKSVTAVMGASLFSSVLFFAVTNFGVWAVEGMYPLTFQGLMTCYTVGIPFFRNTLLGDLFYTALLFGAFGWAERSFPTLKKAVA